MEKLIHKVRPVSILIGDHGHLKWPLNIERRIVEADAFFARLDLHELRDGLHDAGQIDALGRR